MAKFDSEEVAAKDRHSKWYCAFGALAAFVTFLVYLPALGNKFVNWDDQLYVYLNQNIRHFDFDFLKWAFRTDALGTFWNPLTLISFAVDYLILGLNPFQYHLTNIVFHTLNTLLVFFLAVNLYRAARPQAGAARALDPGAVTAGLVTALLFGVHPLHVESVAWISERKDVLYTFFFLLSVLSYLKYARPQGARKVFYYALSLIFFMLSVMSKPMAVTLPLILLILDWHPLGRFAGGVNGHSLIKTAVFEKVPFFAVSLLSGLLTITSMYGHGHVATGLSLLVRILVSIRGYIFYIYKMFLPFNLAPLYPYPEVVFVFGYTTLISVAAFILIAVFCVLTFRRWRSFPAAWMAFLIMLLPVIGIIKNGYQSAADRYTYMPLLGFFLLAGFGAAKLIEGTKGYVRLIAVVPAIIFFIALSSLTIRQEAVWKDPVTLWTRQIDLYPDQAEAVYYYRAHGYTKKGDFANAAKDYTVYINSKVFDPTNASVYLGRGIAYMELKDFDAALKDIDKAIELTPDSGRAVLARGVLHARAGRYQQAVEDLQNGLKLQPENAFAIYNLGACYERLGRRKEAAAYFKKARDMGMKSPEAPLELVPRIDIQ